MRKTFLIEEVRYGALGGASFDCEVEGRKVIFSLHLCKV